MKVLGVLKLIIFVGDDRLSLFDLIVIVLIIYFLFIIFGELFFIVVFIVYVNKN